METQEKTSTVQVDETSDRRSRLIDGVSTLDSFAGWGPRMESSVRNVLRGLN